jgi:hypothetical protein
MSELSTLLKSGHRRESGNSERERPADSHLIRPLFSTSNDELQHGRRSRGIGACYCGSLHPGLTKR